MTPAPHDAARLVIPSDPERIAEADEFLETTLRRHAVPESLVTDLAIVATELVNNAIVHGNRSDVRKTVSLTIQFTGRDVLIRVADQGTGFDPAAIPDPLAEENLLREVGRGVFIVRSLMDEVRYEQDPGGGTVVVVRKSLAPV
ncbi:MAG: ATP-binding protein [candidate division Zixibacteria bacterium]|nr:ATP-binding protein [candidate division Zixibacteria bacterium]